MDEETEECWNRLFPVYPAVEEKAARIAFGLGVADGSIGYDEILNWVISHKIME